MEHPIKLTLLCLFYMSIQKDDPHLYGVLNSMLQGLCYWMGYRMECYAGHSILEGAAVDIAVGLINNHIDHHTYVVKMEYPYRKLGVSNSKERADIVILKKESKKENNLIPVCVMEFKRADDTNGGIWADIEN